MYTFKLLVYNCFYLIIFLLSSTITKAISHKINAEQISIKNGLSDNTVNYIFQDKVGYMWFGTNDGLNKYNGDKIQVYRPNNNFLNILGLCELSDSTIWIASTKGIYGFDPKNESFFYKSDTSKVKSTNIFLDRVNSIIANKNDDLYILSNKGLYLLNKAGREKRKYKYIKLLTSENTRYSKYSLNFKVAFLDKDKILWIGNANNELIRYNTINRQANIIKVNNKKRTTVQVIKEINDSTLVLGGINSGLVYLNKKTLEVYETYNSKNNKISHKDIYAITKDNKQQIWLGTWNGIDVLNQKDLNSKNGNITHYNWDHPLLTNKLENRINSLFFDASGVIWVGTFGGGIVKIYQEYGNFKRLNIPNKKNIDIEINNINIDNMSHLWLSSYHLGLFTSTSPVFSNDPIVLRRGINLNSYTKAPVNYHIFDKDNNLWFSLGKKGIACKYYDSKKTRIFKFNNRAKVVHLFIDSKNKMWISTTQGLIYFDIQKETFKYGKYIQNSRWRLNNNSVKLIFEDSKNNIWIGTNQGLNKLIYHKDSTFQFNHFNDIYIPTEKLISKEVWYIFEDSQSTIWIGYKGGLGKFIPDEGKIIFYTTRDGLCDNFITGICEDDNNNLWLATDAGISCFDKRTQKFTNYFVSNNNRSIYKDKNGLIYIGNNRGITYFNPNELIKNKYKANVVLSTYKIKNIDIPLLYSNTPKPRSIQYSNNFTIKHKDNSFSFFFTSLSFFHQKNNSYAYKLENYNNDWIYTSATNNKVSYNNLEPGDYILKIKASNNNHVWNPDYLAINIKVLPPWWKTWIFKISFLLFIISIIFTFYKFRINKLIKNQERELKQNELENNLKISKLERKKEKEVNLAKTSFFMNISHEIRTPLSLIIAPLNEIMNSSKDSSITNKLLLVNKNADILLSLINQILDFRKIETNNTKLHISNEDIVNVSKDVFDSFTDMARIKQINYIYNSNISYLETKIDKKKMISILTNIISNAFKYTHTGSISLDIIAKKNEYAFIITDSGIGIAESEFNNIFKRFHTLANKDTTGTGLGLAIAEEFTLMHKGNISVESKKDLGSIFKISFPLQPNSIVNIKTIHNKHRNIEITNAEIQTNTNKEHILLIVEDNVDLSDFLCELFSPIYTVIRAMDGEEGILMATKEIPDIIISDVMMPKVNGYELCKSLKTNDKTSHIPIIILTAKTTPNEQIEGLSTGADDYICKPFDPQILKFKLNNLLNSRIKLRKKYSKIINIDPSNIEASDIDGLFIKKAVDFIESNLQNNIFNTKTLSSHLNMSQSTLYRKIKALTNLTINEFIRSIRIKRAAQLILQKEYSITEISEMVGFNDKAYFRKCFSKEFEVTPSKYCEYKHHKDNMTKETSKND